MTYLLAILILFAKLLSVPTLAISPASSFAGGIPPAEFTLSCAITNQDSRAWQVRVFHILDEHYTVLDSGVSVFFPPGWMWVDTVEPYSTYTYAITVAVQPGSSSVAGLGYPAYDWCQVETDTWVGEPVKHTLQVFRPPVIVQRAAFPVVLA